MPREKRHKRVIVWMRRALRVQDNSALNAAARDAEVVIPVLCLNSDADYRLDTPRRRYVSSAIASLDSQLLSLDSRLFALHGDMENELPAFALRSGANAVYAVEVYDPIALTRDMAIRNSLKMNGIEFLTFKDRVMFEKEEILNQSMLPFKVFTPYKRVWLENVSDVPTVLPKTKSLISPDVVGYELTGRLSKVTTTIETNAGQDAARKHLRKFIKQKAALYKSQRDLPAIDGTSKLSAALSLGVMSIREVFWAAIEAKKDAARMGRENIDLFISELIWREFYYQILSNFPHVVHRSFKDDFVHLPWSKNEERFAAWCEGRTGYPIVDAGMRQLVLEGWMHNRVRMIVASFLTKDLHISWQWGEAFFFDHLCDADIASNNGGWQWSAGTGTDAQPWFRIFNPISQSERFDPDGDYVRKYVTELESVPTEYIHAPWTMNQQEQLACGVRIGKTYPEPIVDHGTERAVTIQLYKGGAGSQRTSSSIR